MKRPSTLIASAIACAWLVIALAMPIVPLDPNAIDLPSILMPPSLSALGGYDDLGRSMFLRVLHGATVSCSVALVAVVIAASLGTFIGLLAAWIGGLGDLCIVRIMDMFLAFPGILLAIALAGILGPGLNNVVIALCAVGWVGFARLARAQGLSIKHRDHVIIARALGTSTPRILWQHVLPLAAAPLIVEFTFAIAGFVIAEAGLSFLGLGVQPPTPSWGAMIKDGTRFMLVAPHMVIVPGAALFSLVFAVNLLGDRLRDRWQVK